MLENECPVEDLNTILSLSIKNNYTEVFDTILHYIKIQEKKLNLEESDKEIGETFLHLYYYRYL